MFCNWCLYRSLINITVNNWCHWLHKNISNNAKFQCNNYNEAKLPKLPTLNKCSARSIWKTFRFLLVFPMSVLGRTKPLKNVTSLPCFWKTGSEKASDWSEPLRCLEDGRSQIMQQKPDNFIRRILNIEELSVIWHSWWSEEMFPRKPRVFSSHWDSALSAHRGPELPQSLHSPLWSPSSSQLKALNSYYWAADNMQIWGGR